MAKAKREALATSTAKKLVVAEPESVIFGQADGRQPSYNVQLTVDLETQVVIDAEPIGNPSDSGQLAPTAERLAPLLDVRPPASEPTAEATPAVTLVADAGYSSANDAVACENLGFIRGPRGSLLPRGGIPVFPVMRTVNPHGQFFNRTDVTHDAERDRMVCPAGKALKPLPKPQEGAVVYQARKADCGACALKARCTKAKVRKVHRLINEPALERVALRLKADPTLMNKRAQSVEPAFGTLKRWLNGGRFLLRGRLKAKTELGLVTLAFNLKRLTNLHGTAKIQQALA